MHDNTKKVLDAVQTVLSAASKDANIMTSIKKTAGLTDQELADVVAGLRTANTTLFDCQMLLEDLMRETRVTFPPKT